MFILLINFCECKGTAVLGGGQIFRGFMPEVVATLGAIGDKGGECNHGVGSIDQKMISGTDPMIINCGTCQTCEG